MGTQIDFKVSFSTANIGDALTYQGPNSPMLFKPAGGTPGGSNGQAQFNSGGSFGGTPNLAFSGTTSNMTGLLSQTGDGAGSFAGYPALQYSRIDTANNSWNTVYGNLVAGSANEWATIVDDSGDFTVQNTTTFIGFTMFPDGTFAFSKALNLPQIATPANPTAGHTLVYVKADNNVYTKTSAGVESQVGGFNEFVFSATVIGADVNSIDTGAVLDLNADGGEWDFEFIQAKAAASASNYIKLFVNNDTTDGDYSAKLFGGGTSALPAIGTAAPANGKGTIIRGTIYITSESTLIIITRADRVEATVTEFYIAQKTATVANVTQLQVKANSAGLEFGIGSKLTIWKKKQS